MPEQLLCEVQDGVLVLHEECPLETGHGGLDGEMVVATLHTENETEATRLERLLNDVARRDEGVDPAICWYVDQDRVGEVIQRLAAYPA